MMKYKGNAWLFGRDIDTDLIIPARYLKTSDPVELGKHCMEDADPDFVNKVKAGDIIVAQENFGCGSSREHAPIAIKAAGVPVVIAKSFARIFYRNAINMGLVIMESPEAVDGINLGDEVEVNTDSGRIVNLTTGKEYQAKPFPEFIGNIIKQGGLINYVKEKVNAEKANA
jgi:3-isopropylmalate/(R)-2-methylmalate dehydratase small subunit